MANRAIRFAGFEISVILNKDGLSIRGTIRNRLWRSFYQWLQHTRDRRKQASAPPPDDRLPAGDDATPEQRELLKLVAQTKWYHSIDLGHSVVTPGVFDHRPYLHAYHLPDRMDGLRVLDIATFDGFWAFEFEKRGAKEVVAIDVECLGDIDLPTAKRAELTAEELNKQRYKGFEIAHKVLKSRVRREIVNIYDLSPSAFGKFDIVHIGDVLLHLMNPLQALQNVFNVTSGYALISDCCWPNLSHLGMDNLVQYAKWDYGEWWRFSREALEQMILDAGFTKVELLSTFRYGARGMGDPLQHAVFRASP